MKFKNSTSLFGYRGLAADPQWIYLLPTEGAYQ